MRSSFFGLNVASQGLFTAQTALDVTNHNISNMETPGYSRQYAVQKATRPLPNSYRGMVGTGAEILDVKQYRSNYIDKKYWSMTTDQGQYGVKAEMLNQFELMFNEPSTSGYNASINELFDNMQVLAKNPSEPAVRSNFLDSVDNFAKYFNNLATQFASTQRDANYGVKVSIEEINSLTTQLGSVNQQIGNMEMGGISANDLRDERVSLIDRLAQIVNIETNETVDVNGKKNFQVTINGQTLVDGGSTNYLKVVPRTGLCNVEDEPDLYDIYWTGGQKLYINNEYASGELKGYLDIRDGNNNSNFKGDIVLPMVPPNTTITIENISTSDIPPTGTLKINNQEIAYTSFAYNSVGPQITFTLATPAPATATTVKMGEEVDFKGIPYYTKQLNEFVRVLAREFNALHKSGNGATGTELFSTKGYTGIPLALDETNDFTYNQITIDNFACSENILNDNSLLLTSATVNAGESANDLLLSMINLRHDADLYDKGEPDNFMQSLIGQVGIDSKQTAAFKKGQDNLINLVVQQRKSISSVDMNEETADMLKFQQAYNLSAKMMSVMDEIYEVMINQLVR